MKFRRDLLDDELEINLVPLIDVLLVILIFLAATTSFTRFQQMQVSLPHASSQAPEADAPLLLAISSEGQYALNDRLMSSPSQQELVNTLREQSKNTPDVVLVIHADAKATHESVIRVMDAARAADIHRIHFATQSAP